MTFFESLITLIAGAAVFSALEYRPLRLPMTPGLTRVVMAVAVLGSSIGCSGETASMSRQPLFGSGQVPLVLTESTSIALPPALEANRFVRGWRSHKAPGVRRTLAMKDEARLQGVHLGGSRRRLILKGRVSKNENAVAHVRFESGEWRQVPLRSRMSIRLPRDLPLGRFTVDLRVAEGSFLGLTRAEFSTSLPAGEVRFDGGDLFQSGHSLVETVHRVDGPGMLEGEFWPPRDALPGQRFSILLDDGDVEREIFAWSSKSAETTERTVKKDLPAGDRLVRIRLRAEGEGPPARWKGLALSSRVASGTPSSPGPPGPPELPKIVILYIMDALRADHLGHLEGPDGISPYIDRLASEGATFRRHFSIAPNTVPSMKSLFTGRVFLDTGGHKLSRELPTLPGAFSRAGFHTGLFSGNGNVSDWRGMTRDFDFVARSVLFSSRKRRGEATYNDNAERVHAAALRWIESFDSDERLFLHLQTVHPHNPYDPPEPFLSRFATVPGSKINGSTKMLTDILQVRRAVTEADERRLRGLYAAGVAYNDRELEEFMTGVLERYAPEEVLLVVTSDHGEELFDHGGVLHGYSLYDEQLHIPMVVWWPGTVPSKTIDEPTVNIDLHASLSALARPDAGAEGGGRSLWPLLTGEMKDALDSKENVIYAAASSVHGGIYMARTERYKVIFAPQTGYSWGMGNGGSRTRDPEYLFDLTLDPGETENMAGDRTLESDWLWSKLLAWIEAGKRLETGEPLEEMDEETRQSLRALGYLQ